MSLAEIQNVVLLFSNPVWSGSNEVPSTIIRNLTAFSTQIAYESVFNANLTTLSTNDASTTNGILQGLLYVPELDADHPCATSQYEDPVYLPTNVTKRSDLPPADYKLIAIAPWYNDNCTIAYLDAVRYDPIQGFIFYRPSNALSYNPDEKNQDSSSWRPARAGKNWAKKYRFPIYGVPTESGGAMVTALSKYSGTVDSVPYGENITSLFNPNNEDYVRIWTQMRVTDDEDRPPIWEFFVIVLASLLGVFAGVSLIMHIIQHRRRKQLEGRVRKGEVDLEAMGITRVPVPIEHIKAEFPLFTYYYDPETMTPPSTPLSTSVSARARRLSRPERAISEVVSGVGNGGSGGTTTSKGGSVSESNYTAVGSNYQPQCSVCNVAFENRVSVIRQLPCFHIFHAECIEEYLIHVSCLCPLCRQSMLPEGHVPRITNSMVYKERRIHRLRGHVLFDNLNGKEEVEDATLWSQLVAYLSKSGSFIPYQRQNSENSMAISEKSNPRDIHRLRPMASNTSDWPVVSCGSLRQRPAPHHAAGILTPDSIPEGVTVEHREELNTNRNKSTATLEHLIQNVPATTIGHDGGHDSSLRSDVSLPSSTHPNQARLAANTPSQPPNLPLAPPRTRQKRARKKAITIASLPIIPPLQEGVGLPTDTMTGSGRRSPGTLRRLRVRQYAQRLAVEESSAVHGRPIWHRATTKVFPTLG